MIKQFAVYLMNSTDFVKQLVNCANEFSAKCICQGLFPNMRVIEVVEQ